MRNFTIILAIVLSTLTFAQEKEDTKLPYYEIPEHSKEFTAGTVAARMVDGLGFRYYWATEGLIEKDLEFKPSEEARTTAETIDHIYNLSEVIVNSTLQKVNDRSVEKPELNFAEKRKQTLLNFKTAAEILRESTDLNSYKLQFKNEKGISEFPFWNNINGPIADAIWHCGQVVSFRRSSGNPFNSKASLLRGKLRK